MSSFAASKLLQEKTILTAQTKMKKYVEYWRINPLNTIPLWYQRLKVFTSLAPISDLKATFILKVYLRRNLAEEANDNRLMSQIRSVHQSRRAFKFKRKQITEEINSKNASSLSQRKVIKRERKRSQTKLLVMLPKRTEQVTQMRRNKIYR